jgi:hypothetical protein
MVDTSPTERAQATRERMECSSSPYSSIPGKRLSSIETDFGRDWGLKGGGHSYTEQYLSSMGQFKDVVISLLSALAKQERIRIGERTKAGLERAKAQGKTLGRPKGSRSKKVNPKVNAAKKLREQGMSYGEIGKVLETTRQYAHQLCKAAAEG